MNFIISDHAIVKSSSTRSSSNSSNSVRCSIAVVLVFFAYSEVDKQFLLKLHMRYFVGFRSKFKLTCKKISLNKVYLSSAGFHFLSEYVLD